MVLDNKLATALGLVTGAYVSIFGLPGLNGKTNETVTDTTAIVQQADSSLLESIAQHVPELSQAHAGGVPENDELERYLHQPVEETIGEKGVDYIEVNDDNYDQIVFNSDRPVMVLFYVDTDEYGNTHPSRGLAALARVLDREYEEDGVLEGYAKDDILFCAYKVSHSETVSYEKGQSMKNKYPIDDLPALIFYDNDSGKIKYFDDISVMGGIRTIEQFNTYSSILLNKIPEELFD